MWAASGGMFQELMLTEGVLMEPRLTLGVDQHLDTSMLEA